MKKSEILEAIFFHIFKLNSDEKKFFRSENFFVSFLYIYQVIVFAEISKKNFENLVKIRKVSFQFFQSKKFELERGTAESVKFNDFSAFFMVSYYKLLAQGVSRFIPAIWEITDTLVSHNMIESEARHSVASMCVCV